MRQIKMNETLKLFSLHGRRALITGSGRGIGLARRADWRAPARRS
jgi:gluconate 5-dehydrogenase